MEELRQTVSSSIKKALIPMKAYAREYEPYLELINMDINLYIKLVFISLSEFVFVFIIYLKVLFPGNVNSMNVILTPGIRRCS